MWGTADPPGPVAEELRLGDGSLLLCTTQLRERSGQMNIRQCVDYKADPLLKLASQGERTRSIRYSASSIPSFARSRARPRSRGPSINMETTALMHESFLRFVDSTELVLNDRKHFFAYTAKTMRN